MLCAERLRKPIGRGDADHSGAMVSPRDQVTSQKLQFGTNIICQCLSCSAQFGAFIRSSGCQCSGYLAIDKTAFTGLFVVTDASSFHDKARISTASSSANYLTTGIDVDTIADGPERTKYGEWELYKKSEPNNSPYLRHDRRVTS
jgi:hypothetical protein